jgi:HK97 family phage major capsid protein
MPTTHPNPKLVKAARLLEQAREIKDRARSDEPLSRADADQIDTLLRESSNLRKDAEREAKMSELSDYFREPQYKHDMSGGSGPAGYAAGGSADGPLSPQTKQFLRYIRTGAPEAKAALIEDATGQNLVPADYAGTILKELGREATIRSLAFVRPTTRNLVDVGSVAIGTPTWDKLEVGAEAPADGLGATPAAKQTIEVFDLNALVKIGRDELDDSDESLAETIRLGVAAAFAEVEDDAFAGGSGTGRPWAIHHTVTQGITAAVNATPTPDDLKKLKFTVPARFRKRGVYLAHSSAAEAVALFKDNDGRYLLQPAVALGQPASFDGSPFYTVDGLPAMTATGTATDPSVVFGDVFSGYMVCDRRRLTVDVLRETFLATEGKIGLLFTHRVGGDVVRPKALARYLL